MNIIYRVFVCLACISFMIAGLIDSVVSKNYTTGVSSFLLGVVNFLLLYH